MLSSYPSCNIHLILKFHVGLKYIRAVPSVVLQKMGQNFDDENLDGLVISQGGWGERGEGAGTLLILLCTL